MYASLVTVLPVHALRLREALGEEDLPGMLCYFYPRPVLLFPPPALLLPLCARSVLLFLTRYRVLSCLRVSRSG